MKIKALTPAKDNQPPTSSLLYLTRLLRRCCLYVCRQYTLMYSGGRKSVWNECHLDAIMAVVKQLTSTNATQDGVNTVVNHVMSAYRRQRVTLYIASHQYTATDSPFSIHTIYSYLFCSVNSITKPKLGIERVQPCTR